MNIKIAKLFYVISMILLLQGCGTFSSHGTMTKVDYKYNRIPDELLIVPDKVAPLDITKATQKDVSVYLIKHYKREQVLEDQIILIKEYQDKSLEE